MFNDTLLVLAVCLLVILVFITLFILLEGIRKEKLDKEAKENEFKKRRDIEKKVESDNIEYETWLWLRCKKKNDNSVDYRNPFNLSFNHFKMFCTVWPSYDSFDLPLFDCDRRVIVFEKGHRIVYDFNKCIFIYEHEDCLSVLSIYYAEIKQIQKVALRSSLCVKFFSLHDEAMNSLRNVNISRTEQE